MHIALVIVGLALGGISVGESGALLIGMSMQEEGKNWLTTTNISWALSDIGLGAIAGIIPFFARSVLWIFVASALALCATNLIRGIQFLMIGDKGFCFNFPLFAVNVLKFALAVSACIVAAIMLTGNDGLS